MFYRVPHQAHVLLAAVAQGGLTSDADVPGRMSIDLDDGEEATMEVIYCRVRR